MLMLGQLHWIAMLKDPGKLVQARTGLLFARWVAMLLVGVLAISLPREVYLVLVVLAYAASTVALEPVPERVLTAMNAQDLLDALATRDADPRHRRLRNLMTAFPGAYCVISDVRFENESPCAHQRVIDMTGSVRTWQ
jgi:hypothetical protein